LTYNFELSPTQSFDTFWVQRVIHRGLCQPHLPFDL